MRLNAGFESRPRINCGESSEGGGDFGSGAISHLGPPRKERACAVERLKNCAVTFSYFRILKMCDDDDKNQFENPFFVRGLVQGLINNFSVAGKVTNVPWFAILFRRQSFRKTDTEEF